jgi:hypothetical protein
MLCRIVRLDSLLERVGAVNGDLGLSGIDPMCDGAQTLGAQLRTWPACVGHLCRCTAFNKWDAEVPNGV